MIKIRKPPKPPAILRGTGEGPRECSRLVREFARGARRFTFERGIYAHPTVKEALKQAQDSKCCFCEAKVAHITHGDVEHFRPKAGFRQKPRDPLHTPGYFWLAYDWSNLFLSCQLCNQRYKRNLFPLRNPGARATSHAARLAQEFPLFVNPGEDDPGLYILFHEEMPLGIDAEGRGDATIEALGLDRSELNDDRLGHWQVLKMMHEIANGLPTTSLAVAAKAHLRNAILDSAEYAAMARAGVAREFSL